MRAGTSGGAASACLSVSSPMAFPSYSVALAARQERHPVVERVGAVAEAAVGGDQRRVEAPRRRQVEAVLQGVLQLSGERDGVVQQLAVGRQADQLLAQAFQPMLAAAAGVFRRHFPL